MRRVRRVYVFDIDGTLADASHRIHFIQNEPKDWDAFFDACSEDKPIKHMIQLVNDIYASGAHIVYVSGRSDRVRNKTMDWLFMHALPMSDLHMRRDGDHRPDYVVKKELLGLLREAGFEPIMAFDDRDQVVKMWRDEGIPCAQVAEGNF